MIGLIFGNFKFRAAALTIGLAIGITDGLTVNLLKHTIARPRPSQVEPGVRCVELGKPPKPLPKIMGILNDPITSFPNGETLPHDCVGIVAAPDSSHQIQGRSFPSGHAANNMAVATVLILFYRRWGWLYLPVALLIAYARIYTGAHWPLDVGAGLLIGWIGGWLAVKLMQFLWHRFGARIFPKQYSAFPDLIA